MLESLFGGLFDTSLTRVIAPGDFLLCIGTSLLAGLLLCATTLWRCRCSRSFAVTPAILPAVVCVVILMVNGNIGTGVAVAGTFNLVRFRSAPGSAREIASLFIAMGSGLISGMGYLLYALLFAACLLCAQGLCEDTASASAETGISGQQVDLSALFSDQDLDGSYDESSAVSILLNGGSASVDLTASDAFSFGGPMAQAQTSDTEETSTSQKGIKAEGTIAIAGGTFTIVSGGDCLDSNGDLTLNGSVLDLTCNGSGNTALDADGTYANNGADVTTSDGSENNPGGMGGGRRNATQRQRDSAPSAPSQAAP